MSEFKCSKCNQRPKYIYSSWCTYCINKHKRELRATKKETGLKQYGENRSKICNECKKPKEENYMNDSLCKSCRSSINKNKRILFRIENGLPLWGSGRKNTCSSCGKLKEKDMVKESRCKSCKFEARKKNYPVKILDPVYKLKTIARKTLNKYVSLGKINKMPCEVCGKEKVDAHHDDYMKPLDVRWLCRTHHLEYHKNGSIDNKQLDNKD